MFENKTCAGWLLLTGATFTSGTLGADDLPLRMLAPEGKGAGNEEPVAFTTKFGRSRCCNLRPGHDAKAMDAAVVQNILCRGPEWAATGKVLADKN
jgi:hypothetical protein